MARKTKKNSVEGKVTDVGVAPYTNQSSELYFIMKITIDTARTRNSQKLHDQLNDLNEKFGGKKVQVYVQ